MISTHFNRSDLDIQLAQSVNKMTSWKYSKYRIVIQLIYKYNQLISVKDASFLNTAPDTSL